MPTLSAERRVKGKPTFIQFMDEVIASLGKEGRWRTMETYTSAKNSFAAFLGNKKCATTEIDCQLIKAYEAWLKDRGLRMNTISFYMRILRAVYNRAVDRRKTTDKRPFRHVYTGVAKTSKRAVTAEVLKQLLLYEATATKKQQFAINMFFFSFYARGMSFVDMAFLQKSNLDKESITYRRRKTGQWLHVRCEPCLHAIIERYQRPFSRYVLPIITDPEANPIKQYRQCQHRVNRLLKTIGKNIGVPFPLTTYVARHSWATIARNLDIPLNVISQSMGHTNERTTRIYLDSINSDIIDSANHNIIKAIALPRHP